MTDLGNKAVFAANFNRLRREHDKTVTDIAKELNIPYTTVANWSQGNSYPRIDKIERLARYFGVQKSALVESYDPAQVSLIKQAFIAKISTLPDDQILLLSQLIDLWIASRQTDQADLHQLMR